MFELRGDAHRNSQIVVAHPGYVYSGNRKYFIQIFKRLSGLEKQNHCNIVVRVLEIAGPPRAVQIVRNSERHAATVDVLPT